MRAILTYHSVDDSGSPISISPEQFARHVSVLAGGKIRVLDLPEILRPAAERDAEQDAVAITFDDGFVNFAERAWPLLRDHDLPTTLFVVTDRTGGSNEWDAAAGHGVPRMPLLRWGELARLASEGLRLGAHGRTHATLRGIPLWHVIEEVRGSREMLRAETGSAPSAFAYPFGEFDAQAAEVVRKFFAQACTTQWRPLSRSDDPHLLPRLDAFYFRANGRLEEFGSQSFRRWLALRGAVRRAGAMARAIAPDALLRALGRRSWKGPPRAYDGRRGSA